MGIYVFLLCFSPPKTKIEIKTQEKQDREKKNTLTFGCKPFYLVDLKLISLQNTHKVKKDKFFSFYFKKGRGTNLIISCESF